MLALGSSTRGHQPPNWLLLWPRAIARSATTRRLLHAFGQVAGLLADTGYPLLSAAAKRSTIAAAGSTAVIAPTLWPAYIAIASMSPSMPASGMLAA